MDKAELEIVIKKIDIIVNRMMFRQNLTPKQKSVAVHFNNIRTRLLRGKQLTKKMQENVEWLKEADIDDK